MNKTWYKLDTAGLIFPAIRRKNWVNVYRISATLKEDIDLQILQQAVNELQPRFPTLYVSLHPGFFWNYLEKIKGTIKVQSDYAYPLTHMSLQEIKECCIRVLCHKNRVAVEVFHAVTDGTGCSIYVRSLIAHYIKLRYGECFDYSDFVLNPEDKPTNEEMEDSFFKYSNGYPASRKEPVTYRLHGTNTDDGFLTLTTGVINSDVLLEKAHNYNCTITTFISAIMIQAICDIQKEEVLANRQKPVAISVAANLRKIFGSKTLRNFVLAQNIGINPLKGDYTLDELCKILRSQMALQFNKQNMASAIAANVIPQQNLFIRIVPLPLKQAIMDGVYNSHGEKHGCINISNLGYLAVPKEIEKHIERIEFIIGVQRSYPNNCSIASVGNTTCINMIRSIESSELERRFFSRLVELGIPVYIESNRR